AAADGLVRITGQLRVGRTRPRLRRLPWIAFAHQGVEIGKNRRRDQERIILIREIGLVSGAIAQKPHHELRCLARAWISERLLGIGKPVVAADPGSDKRGKKQRRTRGIHLAEADRLDEAAGVVERTNWLIIDAPLFPPKLLQLLLSHDLLTIRTQVEKLRM